MKKILTIVFTVIIAVNANAQSGAALNSSGLAADPSAMLDVSSTTSGILIPRMTEAQKNSITSPATGLIIYQTDAVTGFWYYDGTSWAQSIGQTGPAGATGAVGATGATGFLSSGSAAGNTPYWDGSQWVVNSSNIFNNGGSVGIGTSSPDASAAIDVSSTTKGTLITRMTTTQRNAVSSPAEGLQIFNTDTKCFEFYAYGRWEKGDCGFNCGTENISFTYNGTIITYGTVNGQNNSCWLDRNLGALRVATAYDDASAFGDLFQWGRPGDGHQARNSPTASTLSNTDIPGHSYFILSSVNPPLDWRNPQNDNLWQGASGVNNPCPAGWRIPVYSELNAERTSWSSNNCYGAYASNLKWTVGGYRNSGGVIQDANIYGYCWNSTITDYRAGMMYFYSGSTGMDLFYRASGLSVRCLKDY